MSDKKKIPNPKTDIIEVPIGELVVDDALLVRKATDQDLVDVYAAAYRDGDRFPPILVRRGTNGRLAVIDGHHRVAALRVVGEATIKAEVVTVADEEAVELAVKANARHGKRLSVEDQRHALAQLLRHPNHQTKSNVQLAKMMGVSPSTLGTRRKEVESTLQVVKCSVRQTSDGRAMRVDNIGKSTADRQAAAVQSVPLAPAASNVLQAKGALAERPAAEDDAQEAQVEAIASVVKVVQQPTANPPQHPIQPPVAKQDRLAAPAALDDLLALIALMVAPARGRPFGELLAGGADLLLRELRATFSPKLAELLATAPADPSLPPREELGRILGMPLPVNQVPPAMPAAVPLQAAAPPMAQVEEQEAAPTPMGQRSDTERWEATAPPAIAEAPAAHDVVAPSSTSTTVAPPPSVAVPVTLLSKDAAAAHRLAESLLGDMDPAKRRETAKQLSLCFIRLSNTHPAAYRETVRGIKEVAAIRGTAERIEDFDEGQVSMVVARLLAAHDALASG